MRKGVCYVRTERKEPGAVPNTFTGKLIFNFAKPLDPFQFCIRSFLFRGFVVEYTGEINTKEQTYAIDL